MKNMLQTFNSEQEEDTNLNLSDLKLLSANGQAKTLNDASSRARDSGYVADFSPASTTSVLRQFRFDSETEDYSYGLEEGIGGLEIQDDVFPDENDRDTSALDEMDNTDKEVEDLFSDSGELGSFNSYSQPIEIAPIRPGAPGPTPEGFQDEYQNDSGCSVQDGNNESTDYTISHSFHHTPWNNNRHCRRHVFRPISRSVGTQTPSPHSQVIDEAIELCGSARFQPYRIARGHAVARLRFQSEDDNSEDRNRNTCPLPDVVPFQRDRSVSLPEVPVLRQASEQEVGRELRRISDEFHSSFHTVRRRRTMFQHASSFPLNFDVMSYWDSIRRYLSPVQPECTDNRRCQQEDTHPDQQDH